MIEFSPKKRTGRLYHLNSFVSAVCLIQEMICQKNMVSLNLYFLSAACSFAVIFKQKEESLCLPHFLSLCCFSCRLIGLIANLNNNN